MRSPRRYASAKSCVTTTAATRRSASVARSSSRSARRSGRSSAESGSSSRSSAGSMASARPSATRWRCPPESSAGRRASRPPSPSRSITSPRVARAPPRGRSRSPKPTFSATDEVREERVALEDVADAPALRRADRRRRPRRRARDRRPRCVPASGRSSPARHASVRDLPAPDGPKSTATPSPAVQRTSRSKPGSRFFERDVEPGRVTRRALPAAPRPRAPRTTAR